MRAGLSIPIAAVLVLQLGCRDTTSSDATAPPRPRVASLAPTVVVSDGVYVPPQVKLGQTFQTGFSLRNTGGSAVTFEEIALAIHRPDGSFAFDAVKRASVTIAPGARWSVTQITSLAASSPAGTYRAVARGRLPGGVWFDFGAQGGTNPASFTGSGSPAFAAVIDRINMNPSSVPLGQRPQITANIRNTSTPDTPWQGAATFWIKATIRRNGTVLKQQSWRWSFLADQTLIGFDVVPDYDTSVAGEYEVTYHVYSGDDVHQFATRVATFWVEAGSAAACAAPSEATIKQSYTSFWRPPYGFAGATPWLQVVHDTRSTGASMVEIEFIRLWGKADGVSSVLAANEYDDGKFGGELCSRTPWFGSCHGMPGTVANGVLVIRPSTRPDSVWHPYLESWPDPRFNVTYFDSVWTEIRFRITGAALAQGGLDYWKYAGYSNNRNEEAGATDWMCTQGSWQTLRLGRSTEVVDSIRFSSSSGPTFRVGSPITGTFTIRNSDNETVGLAEAGIEVRVMAANDSYCDWQASPTTIPAFPWLQNVTLAPGASRVQSSSWTPNAAGRYCATVVEKRTNSGYRKVYLRPRFQILQVN